MSDLDPFAIRDRLMAADNLRDLAIWTNADQPTGHIAYRRINPPLVMRDDDIYVMNDGGCRLYYSLPRAVVLSRWFRRKRRSKTVQRFMRTRPR